MPLFYYARQSSLATKEGAKLWHLSLKKVGRAVDAQQLAEVIAEKSSLTPGDVHNVIRNLMTVMRSQLLNKPYGASGWLGHIHHEGPYAR